MNIKFERDLTPQERESVVGWARNALEALHRTVPQENWNDAQRDASGKLERMIVENEEALYLDARAKDEENRKAFEAGRATLRDVTMGAEDYERLHLDEIDGP